MSSLLQCLKHHLTQFPQVGLLRIVSNVYMMSVYSRLVQEGTVKFQCNLRYLLVLSSSCTKRKISSNVPGFYET